MSLISDASDIRARFAALDDRARCAIAPILSGQVQSATDVLPLLREYVRIKYRLEPEDMAEDELEALGRESVARIAALGETGSDTSPHCGSASSATHKKILRVLALGRDLAITIPPMESADAETLTALSECIARALARR